MQTVLAIVQILTLLALIVYVWKTWHIATATTQAANATERAAEATHESVEEMRAARREASDPRVFIYLAQSRTFLAEIVVENLGGSTAADVTFTFEPELQSSQHAERRRDFFEVPMILPPGSRRTHVLDAWWSYFEGKLPERYDVAVRYRRLGEDDFRTEHQVLDAASFKHQLQVERKELHDLVKDFHDFLERFKRWVEDQKHAAGTAERKQLLIPEPVPLAAALAHLVALWRLRAATHEGDRVYLFDSDFLPGLRLHCVAALMAAEREGATAEIKDTLTEAFLGLTHRGWQVLGRNEAPQVLDRAMERLTTLTAKLSDPLLPDSGRLSQVEGLKERSEIEATSEPSDNKHACRAPASSSVSPAADGSEDRAPAGHGSEATPSRSHHLGDLSHP